MMHAENPCNTEYSSEKFAFTRMDKISFMKANQISKAYEIDLSGELTSLTDLKSLTSICKLRIWNTSLANLDGLQNLVWIYNLEIEGNLALTSLDGLESLKDCWQLRVVNNPALTSFYGLQSLKTLGELYIRGESSFKSLEGLHVATIKDSFSLHSNVALESLHGLEDLLSCKVLSIRDNLALTSLQALENLQECEKLDIRGNLALTSLQRLGSLETLQELDIRRNPALTSLRGLSIATIRQKLTIQGNPVLASLQGLQSLKTISRLHIENNSALTSLQGLHITEVNISLRVYDNLALTSLQGLDNLTECMEVVSRGNPALTSLQALDNLRECKRLEIRGSIALTSLKGLENLVGTMDSLKIQDNSALNSLQGLEGITGIMRNLTIRNNPALISLQELERLTGNSPALIIRDNPKLLSLSALRNIQGPKNIYGASMISIQNNSDNMSLIDIEDMFMEGGPYGRMKVHDVLCNPGSSGSQGSQPCNKCPKGRYASAYGSVSCLPCSDGKISRYEAALSCEACGFLQFPNSSLSDCTATAFWFFAVGLVLILPACLLLYLCFARSSRKKAFTSQMREARKKAKSFEVHKVLGIIPRSPIEMEVFRDFVPIYNDPWELFAIRKSCLKEFIKIALDHTKSIVEEGKKRWQFPPFELPAARQRLPSSWLCTRCSAQQANSKGYQAAREYIDRNEKEYYDELMKKADEAVGMVQPYESDLEKVSDDIERTYQMYIQAFAIKTWYFDPLLKDIVGWVRGRNNTCQYLFIRMIMFLWSPPYPKMIGLELAGPKGILRLAEKIALRPGSGLIWDAVRGMVVSGNLKRLAECMDRLIKEAKKGSIEIVGVNNRFAHPTMSGWQDLAVYIRFQAPGMKDIVCEIQMVHRRFLDIRTKFGDHDVYERARFVAELRKNVDGKEEVGVPDSVSSEAHRRRLTDSVSVIHHTRSGAQQLSDSRTTIVEMPSWGFRSKSTPLLEPLGCD